MGILITDLRQNDVEDTKPGGIAADRLRSIIERVERLEGRRRRCPPT